MASALRIGAALVKHALSYPETREDHPWGETAIKVREKAFLFLGKHGNVSFSVKLPASREFALEFPFAEPTHYGLGKHGWVTVTLTRGDELPLDVLKKWVDESFRAVAPKTLVKKLDG
ncbi:MAG: MmcQ/YjbR family DNA-binding protein [Thermoanaerobaculia bacterium]